MFILLIMVNEAPKIENQPIDSQWYDRFASVGSFEAYEYLDGDKEARTAQKEAFLSGDIAEPSLDYPKIDLANLTVREEQLLQLKGEIIAGEPDTTVRELYRWKINEKIAELRLLQAAATGDMRAFRHWSSFVYGRPSPEVFEYSIQKLNEIVDLAATNANPDIRQAAENLKTLLPQVRDTQPVERPSQADQQRARETTLQQLSALGNIDISASSYSATEIADIFTQALQTLQTEGWQVVIDPSSKTAISVDQEHRAVRIPESRQVSGQKLATLLVHEIGTHVARRNSGERSSLRLLGLGLDRYEKGEEGIATMREQAIVGLVDDFSGLEGHLAISLAYGLDGTPRGFRDVFEILQAHFKLKRLLAGDTLDKATISAQNDAWNRAVRTFRGTDCKTPGVCFTKDIVYREGNIAIWSVIHNDKHEMARFSIGKYDPSNPRHIWALTMLGITDAELETTDTK